MSVETEKLATGLRGGHGRRHPKEGLALMVASESQWGVAHAAEVLYKESRISDARDPEKVEKRIEFF